MVSPSHQKLHRIKTPISHQIVFKSGFAEFCTFRSQLRMERIQVGGNPSSAANTASTTATYKARVALDQQHLQAPTGQRLQAGAGMQVAVEIHQGRRTVLEYLLSPVSEAVQEAGREK